MRQFGKWLGRLLLVLVLAGVGLWTFGPYEPVRLQGRFDPAYFDKGVDAWFAAEEARFPDITPGTEKRVIWAGTPGEKTPVSVVYLHGFSATSEEIRPVPDRIAAALGANLVYTRLTGHGRPGAAMATGTVPAWMDDTAEALAAGRAVGERVVVIATSTGGTLAVAAALEPGMVEDLVAMVLISPNFGINDPLAALTTWPAARYWLLLVAGRELNWTPASEAEAKYWTESYPSVAVMPMAALIKAVAALDVTRAKVPALFWFSPDDRVVRPDITAAVAARWGGPVAVRKVTTGPGDDPKSHVVAGDIKSPGQTDLAVREMTAWLEEQLR